jgi:hypothetical protein
MHVETPRRRMGVFFANGTKECSTSDSRRLLHHECAQDPKLSCGNRDVLLADADCSTLDIYLEFIDLDNRLQAGPGTIIDAQGPFSFSMLDRFRTHRWKPMAVNGMTSTKLRYALNVTGILPECYGIITVLAVPGRAFEAGIPGEQLRGRLEGHD